MGTSRYNLETVTLQINGAVYCMVGQSDSVLFFMLYCLLHQRFYYNSNKLTDIGRTPNAS